MASHYPTVHQRPLSDINTTPLIDVLLVLLVMLIITIPVATHSIDVDLTPMEVSIAPDPISNRVGIGADGTLTWNGSPISDGQLVTLITETKAMPVIPEIRFNPSANASYQRSDDVLKIIKQSGILNFGFVDNHRYKDFGKVE